jgi:hypothetical protein
MGRTPDGQRNTGQLAQPSTARSLLFLTHDAVVLAWGQTSAAQRWQACEEDTGRAAAECLTPGTRHRCARQRATCGPVERSQRPRRVC